MSEFVAQIRAELETKNAEAAFNSFKQRIESQKIKPQIDPSFFNNLANNPAFKSCAKNTGKLFSDSMGNAIKDVSSKKIESPFIVDAGGSNGFKDEVESWVRSVQKNIDGAVKIDVKTDTMYDEALDANIERLSQAVVKYNTKSGEAVTKVIRQTKTGVDENGKAIMGFAEVSSNYSKSLDEASAKTDSFVDRQKRAVGTLKISLESIKREYEDQKAPKPIKDMGNIASLEGQYKKAEESINAVSNANKNNFTEMEVEAKRQLSALKDCRNSENVATSLRTKDFSTVKGIAEINLDKFESKIRGSNVPIEQMQEDLDTLSQTLSNAFDATGLTSYLNQFDLADAKFNKLSTDIRSSNANEKVGIRASELESKISDIQRVSGGKIDSFTAQINGADVSVKTLLDDLKAVNSQGDFSVVNTKFNAFTNAAKAAGIQVKETATSIRDIGKDLENGKLDAVSSNMNKQMGNFEGLASEGLEKAKRYLAEYDEALSALKKHRDGISPLNDDDISIFKDRLLSNPEKFKNAMTVIKNDPSLDFSKKIADIESSFKPIETSFQEIQSRISQNADRLGEIGFSKLTGIIEQAKTAQASYNSELKNANTGNIDKIKASMKEVSQLTSKAQKEYEKFASPASAIDQENLLNKFKKWGKENPNAVKAGQQTWDAMVASFNGMLTKGQLEDQKSWLNSFQLEAEAAGTTGMTFIEKVARGFRQIGQFALTYGVIQKIPDIITRSVTELKEMDDTLTEISKTSDMTDAQLKQLGNDAFDSASKYGRDASDYLVGVQEMSRSGFYGKKGTDMAGLSILGQAAGDMTAEVSGSYLLATNAAYKYAGSAEKLNAVLDGQNMITNRNSVSMNDMAVATSEAASMAAETGVAVNELSAIIGTMEARTKSGGSEVGNAIKAILVNLQNTSSKKITETLDKAGASMTEYANGVEQLRNPIDILKDLSKTFNSLEESDPLKSEILTNIGQKYHAKVCVAV